MFFVVFVTILIDIVMRVQGEIWSRSKLGLKGLTPQSNRHATTPMISIITQKTGNENTQTYQEVFFLT